MQLIVVILAFVVALYYVALRIHKSVKAKSCGSACKGCSSIDFSKIDTSKFESQKQ